MSPDHEPLRDLVLSYEDLNLEERARADAHLADCSSCKVLLERLQGLERAARAQGELPPLEDRVAYALTSEQAREADASLEALCGRLGIEAERRERQPRASRPSIWTTVRDLVAGSPSRRRWSAVLVPVAAAAVVALVLLRPTPRVSGYLVRDLRVLSQSEMRGEAPGWHTGEAFVLELDLKQPSQPIVFHVDPSGKPALLYPADPAAPIRSEPAGHLRLPPAESGEEWRFEGPPGREGFLVTATTRSDLPLPEIVEEARRITGADREARLGALRALLERRIGPVEMVEVTHLP